MTTELCPKCGASCTTHRGITGLKKYSSIEAEARDHLIVMANNVADINRRLAAECNKAIDLLKRIAVTEGVPDVVVKEINNLLPEEETENV